MAGATIETRGLTKRYGERVGVLDLDLSIAAGAVFGFLGPNGSGKTTTIRLLLGLLRPDAGSASVLGRDAWRESPAIKRELGYLPGDLALPKGWDGRSALAIGGRVRGLDLTRRGAEIAERLDLDLTVRVHRMSRGTRQKLGIVLALAHDPKVLVLDEPTTGLDPIHQRRFYDLLLEGAGAGATVFFSSHVLSEVEELCDRVGILRDGRLVAEEAVAQLRERASRRVVVTFAGAADGVAPACLDVVSRTPDRWECLLAGEVPELVEWLAGRPVANLEIGPPDLDRLFRAYYGEAS